MASHGGTYRGKGGAIKNVPACCSEGAVKRRGLVAPLLSFGESSSRSLTHDAVGPQNIGPVAPTRHLRRSQLLHRPPQTVGRREPLRPEGCRIWSTQVRVLTGSGRHYNTGFFKRRVSQTLCRAESSSTTLCRTGALPSWGEGGDTNLKKTRDRK